MTGLKALCALALLLTLQSADAGVSFVRWGRTECPTGTHVLYKGYITGPHYNSGGNGMNFLCTHEQPQFVRSQAGNQPYRSYLWGVELEYDTASSTQLLTDNVNGGQLLNQDMVCVRCYVEGSYDVMMIPGRHDCGGSGYDLQYKGFLVAEANLQRARSEYICLDEAPEGAPGGSGNMDQSVFYVAQFRCGSLPCNPFVNDLEVTCAVCTY